MGLVRIVMLLFVLLAPTAGAAAQSLPAGRPDALGLSSARLARIDTLMQAYVDSSRAAGISVMVLRDGKVVKTGTYGWADREARRRLEPDALFRIASQTKAITSIAVMILVEEGKVRLEDPVQRWLPSFANASVAEEQGTVPARRPITIRHLLTHSAGLSTGGEPAIRDAYSAAGFGDGAGPWWYFADRNEPICTIMDRLGHLPLAAHPGERYLYGYSTDVLGCVVERVTGRSLDEFFRERIFRPLEMNDTYFFLPPDRRARLTAVYAATGRGLERASDDGRGQGAYVDGPRVSFSGGAGLVSTIGDYARFLQMLLNEGELDGVRLLSPHTVRLMAADHLDEVYGRPGLGFGLGFEVLEDPGLAGRYGAPGAYRWGGAYATSYWVDPAERLVALIMTQTMPSGGLDAADRFRTLVYSAIVEPVPVQR